MNKGLLVGIAAVLVLGALGAGAWYLQKNKNSTEITTPSIEPNVEALPATKGAVKKFTVEGSNFKFVPATLLVNKGDSVQITFNNTGGSHDFVIDEFNVKTKVISSGESDTASFVADKAGTFDYYCSVDGHRAMGMQGTLTVQ